MSTPPGPLASQGGPPAAPERADAPAHPGVAPPKGEMLEQGLQQPMHADPGAAPSPDPMIQENVIYRTPDGEERLVWVVRNGVAEYFARRPGARWTATLDRGLLSVRDFARQVGLAPG